MMHRARLQPCRAGAATILGSARRAPCRTSLLLTHSLASLRTRAPQTQPARPQRQNAAAAKPTTEIPTGSFDYIIVGGGLAGCILANRLSADPGKEVLLLEAGEDNNDTVVKAPAGITRLFKHPYYDWNLNDTKNEYIARGKLLGGSSSTNATLYHRGTAQDYDGWGVPGWGAKDVLPWFCAAEDNPAFNDSEWHGTGGSMHVENPIYQNSLFETHFEASKEAGLPYNPDFNDWSHSQEGYGNFQVSITSRGRRADGHRQYLAPVLGRENLTVVTRAQTSRVLTEMRGGAPVACAVQTRQILPGARTLQHGKQSVVSVKDGGEVFLTAGAVHSPQILMLSGIGPKEHLEDVGVDVVADSPEVGSNLQDHPACLSAFELKESAGPIAVTDHLYAPGKAEVRKRQLLNWAVRGKGPLTSTFCDRGAFVRTDPALKQPDLQMRYVAGCALDANGVNSFVQFARLKESGGVTKWPSGITFQIIAARPQSRGSIRLASDTIAQPPKIDLGYLNDEEGADRRTLREGLRLSRKLAETKAWQALLEREMHPGAGRQGDDDLDAYINATLHSANALVGTCALGTVVSPQDFTVRGVGGLRVADASVMPKLPGGQAGAPTAMIAERCAALVAARAANVNEVQTSAGPTRELTFA